MRAAVRTSSKALTRAIEHHKTGHLAEAEEQYRLALKKDPRNAQVLGLLGGVCLGLNRAQEAVKLLTRAVELKPGYAPAYDDLARALLASDSIDEAAAVAERLVRLQPDHAPGWARLAGALMAKRDAAGAEARASRALELDPRLISALRVRADARAALGRVDEAVADFEQSLRLQPNDAGFFSLLSLLLRADRFDLGIELSRAYIASKDKSPATEVRGRSPIAYLNLGLAYQLSQRLVDAGECYRKALELAPGNPHAMCNLAKVYIDLGQNEEALSLLEQILAREPEHVEAHVGRAAAWLSRGDFERGWLEHEWRCRWKGEPALGGPKWQGENLAGKTILLYGEQGLGDVLQFVRYAELVERLGARVVLHCSRRLVELLRRCRGVTEVVPIGTEPPPFDYWTGLQSLPRWFKTTIATTPADVPYVHPDQALVDRWRPELAALTGLRVGINWRGRAATSFERSRRMPLSGFVQLAAVPGVTLVSLQKGDGESDLSGDGSISALDLAPRLDLGDDAFVDTAAVMKSLDLVITSDTATAHLAGAVGVPVWVGLSFAPEWRWMRESNVSPWYPTMRLFRQARFDDWTNVFEEMGAELRRKTA